MGFVRVFLASYHRHHHNLYHHLYHQIAAEPYVHQEIAAEPYQHVEIAAEPEVSESVFFNIETRPRIPDTCSQASRQDREKISSNLRHRDEIEIYYLHSQTSRREREFP